MSLVVAGEAAVVHGPAEGPLDDPAPRNHREAILGGVAAGDFDVDAQAGAVLDDLGAVSDVGPGFGDAGVPFGNTSEQIDAACVVGDAGGGDQHGLEEAGSAGADVAFAACDRPARVAAPAGRGHIG